MSDHLNGCPAVDGFGCYCDRIAEAARTLRKAVIYEGAMTEINEYARLGLGSHKPEHWEGALSDIVAILNKLGLD